MMINQIDTILLILQPEKRIASPWSGPNLTGRSPKGERRAVNSTSRPWPGFEKMVQLRLISTLILTCNPNPDRLEISGNIQRRCNEALVRIINLFVEDGPSRKHHCSLTYFKHKARTGTVYLV